MDIINGAENRSIRGSVKRFISEHQVIHLILAAFVLNLTVELLGRHSLIGALRFAVTSPLQFLLGTLIICATLALSLAVPRRRFCFLLVSLVWLGLAVANFIVLCFRVTPLCAIDLILLKSTVSIIGYYLSVWQIVLAACAIILALAGVVYAFIKSKPKVRRGIGKALSAVVKFAFLAGITVALSAVNSVFAKTTGRLSDDYSNNGFTYSFCSTFFDRGIDEPEDYSEQAVRSAVEKIESASAGNAAESGELPNIIFVQLESVMDLSHIKGLTLSENPSPVLAALKNVCRHGTLTVPVTGCGTANTEFEVLTGMNVGDFGTGEFPYDTVLQKVACESAATNLKTLGYSTHTLHNNNAGFYSRDTVYSMLGFDSFTSLEFMQNVSYNSIGWARDEGLTSEIEKLLSSTGGRDFIYTVSVQSHGKYPDDYEGGDFTASFKSEDPERRYDRISEVEYYAQQLNEVDAFVGDLLNSLASSDEPAVLVLFGDHIPELGFTAEDMDNGSLYKTDYIIWDSRKDPSPEQFKERVDDKAVTEDVPLEAYQLYPYVCAEAGLDLSGFGSIARLEAFMRDSEDSGRLLTLLEYDTLYGLGFSLGGGFSPSEMVFGTEAPILDSVVREGELIILRGKNFTPFCRVVADGKLLRTEYVSQDELTVTENRGGSFSVAVADGNRILQSSGEKELPAS